MTEAFSANGEPLRKPSSAGEEADQAAITREALHEIFAIPEAAAKAFDGDAPPRWSDLDQAYARARPALKSAQTCFEMGTFLRRAGHYQQAWRSLVEALAMFRHCTGDKGRQVAETLAQLSALLDDVHTACALHNLGALHCTMGQLAETESYLTRALIIRREISDPAMAATLNCLGYVHEARGNLETARDYYEQALAIRRRLLGQDHIHTAESLASLGMLRYACGDLQAALAYLEEVCTIAIGSTGAADSAAPPMAPAEWLNALGVVLRELSNFDEAITRLEQARTCSERGPGKDHLQMAQIQSNLGLAYFQRGDRARACSNMEQALALYEEISGADHPETQFVRMELRSLRQ